MLFDCLKNTKHRLTPQRKIILEEIRKVHTHPTAEEVFEMVRERIPNISVATVYRNLEFLVEKGLIIKLKSKDKKTRFDGNEKPHFHLVCNCCFKIIDIFDCKCKPPCSKQINKCGFEIDTACMELSGLCKKCKKT